jgi:ribonuclease HI
MSAASRNPPQKQKFHRLHVDGGIVVDRPGQAAGEAAIGVVLKSPEGLLIHYVSARIGRTKDHHIAEYRALIAGLRLARGHGIDDIRVFLDSRLVDNQVNGRSRVKNDYLQFLTEVLALMRKFVDIKVSWVPRKTNREAHKLADQALASIR